MKGREAIENFCKQNNYKFYKVVCVDIFATLKSLPIFSGNCEMDFKENYNAGCVQIDCLDDSLQAMKFGSSWNTSDHNITFENGKLIIIDEKKELKLIIVGI